jgi:hypothetical protein
MVVTIRQQILDKLAETPVRDFAGALHYAGVQQFLHQRSERQRQLLLQGLMP